MSLFGIRFSLFARPCSHPAITLCQTILKLPDLQERRAALDKTAAEIKASGHLLLTFEHRPSCA